LSGECEFVSESFFKPLVGIDYEQTDNINGNTRVNVKEISRGGSCT